MTSTIVPKDACFNDHHPQDHTEYICHDSTCDNIKMPSSLTVSGCEILDTKDSVRKGKSPECILGLGK